MDQEQGLTKNQMLIWLGQEAHPDLPLFNELALVEFSGVLNVEIFSQAFQRIVNATDAMRSTVSRVDDKPRLDILDEMDASTASIDFSSMQDPQQELQAWAGRQVDQVLNLDQCSFRSTVIKLSDSRYVWAYLQHHLFSDGRSMENLFARLEDVYEALSENRALGSLTYPAYAEYFHYERNFRESRRYSSIKKYWDEKLIEPPQPATFYHGRLLSIQDGLRCEHEYVKLEKATCETLSRLMQSEGIASKSQDLSVFSLFAAVFYIYLFRISGQTRLSMGVPLQNRPSAFRDTIGLLMEQNPFIVSLDPDESFRSVVGKVKNETMDVMRHLPFAAGNPGRRHYNVTLNLIKGRAVSFAGLPTSLHCLTPSYGANALGIKHFTQCLNTCINKPDAPIEQVNLLTDNEQMQLISNGLSAPMALPSMLTTVPELIEQQVALHPDAIAVVSGMQSLSYIQLMNRSHHLAQHLKSRGIRVGDCVGVYLDRSVDICTAIIGIMMSGAAYVPLDPSYPRKRLQCMIKDSGTETLLVDRTSIPSINDTDIALIHLCDEFWNEISDQCAPIEPANTSNVISSAKSDAKPEALAYVLYTSGSTGEPKGVDIPHRALSNLLLSMQKKPGFSSCDTLLAVTTVSFDIAALELLLPLISGGQVHIASHTVSADSYQLAELIQRSGATVLQATPSTLRMLISSGWSTSNELRVFCGGEPLSRTLADAVLDAGAELWNMYGPTETTIWSSVQPIYKDNVDIGIGRPIANTQYLVVDEQMQLVPVGVPGELLIGGAGLARGYRNQAKLSAEKFIQHPNVLNDDAIAYKTGDLVRWNRDGKLVHLGRLDQQMKVRGFRVEAMEIETVLDQHPSVSSSVILQINSGESDAYLIAYVQLLPDHTLSASQMRDYLGRTLPSYMLPAALICVDSFPLTANGKLDKQALLDSPVTKPQAEQTTKQPRTDTQVQIRRMWQSLLHRDSIGIDQDFWEIGGQSLVALELISQVRKVFNVQLSPQALIQATTIESMAKIVDESAVEQQALSYVPKHSDQIPITTNAQLQDVERELLSLWQSTLATPEGNRETDVFDAPVTAELLPELLQATRKRYGTFAEGLSIGQSGDDLTIRNLASAIVQNMNEAMSSLAVPLQPHGERTPLFLVHAAGGYVFFYRALSKLLDLNRPIYGIRAATVSNLQSESSDALVDDVMPFLQTKSVEELASSYIKQIKRVQPKGPYTLGGACFGAIVAYEMAQQLQAAGERIEGPVLAFSSLMWNNNYVSSEDRSSLIDSGYYHESRWQFIVRKSRRQYVKVTNLGFSADSVKYVSQSLFRESYNSCSYIKNVASKHIERYRVRDDGCLDTTTCVSTSTGNNLAESIESGLPDTENFSESTHALQIIEQQAYWEQSLQHSLHLGSRYTPERYNGSLAVFQSDQSGPCSVSWRGLAIREFDVFDMPGHHLDMLEEPAVENTVQMLRKLLVNA